jgi:hypothetical protein
MSQVARIDHRNGSIATNKEIGNTMFTHYSDPHGCEWLGGELNAFVDHYNQSNGAAYALVQCLDVVKISGLSPKEPEVLLTDKISGLQMVIERKSVVTPASYIHQHQLEHEFADLIWAETKGKFGDDGYVLTAGMQEIRRLSSARMRATARAIGKRTARLSIGEIPFRSDEPIAWSFRRLMPGEEEVPRRGIVVNHVKSMSFDDSDHEEAFAELPRGCRNRSTPPQRSSTGINSQSRWCFSTSTARSCGRRMSHRFSRRFAFRPLSMRCGERSVTGFQQMIIASGMSDFLDGIECFLTPISLLGRGTAKS